MYNEIKSKKKIDHPLKMLVSCFSYTTVTSAPRNYNPLKRSGVAICCLRLNFNES